MISNAMKPFLAGSSTIRAMFEEGKRMAKVYGEENVYDFSIGNPGLNPPQEVFDAIDEINHKLDPHYVHSYPSNAGYESTRKAVADDLNERAGGDYFDADHIIMTCGAGYAINIINKCIFDPGDKLVVFAPYFVEYGNWARNWGADTLVVPANPELKFDPDAEALRKILVPEVKAVMLNTPNNPTGNSLTSEEIGRIADNVPSDTMILVDEAYASFITSDVDYIAPLVNKHHNLIISRTLSKFYGLPGLRMGFGFIGKGNEDFLNYANKYLGYNRFSEAVALAALESDEHYRNVANDMEWDRQLFKSELGNLPGFKVYKSVANFILVKYPVAIKEKLQEELKAQNYKIKFMTDKGLEDCLRITLGRREQIQVVVDTIKRIATAL